MKEIRMNKTKKILLITSLYLASLVACAPQTVNTPPTTTPTAPPTTTPTALPTTTPTALPTTTPTALPTTTPTAPPTVQPTEIPFSEGDFALPMQLDFESREDFKYFDILGSIGDLDQSDAILKDGTAIFGQSPVGGANLKPLVNNDTALHIRWKINDENTCERFSLAPFVSQENIIDAYMVGVGGCSFQALQTQLASLGSDAPVAYDSPFRNQGTLVMEDGQWLDVVFWIEKGTPTSSLKLFAWQTENPNIYYAEKRLLNGLEDANMFMFSFDVFFGSIAVDSFQMISGNVESYLWFNAPSFSKNYEDLKVLFDINLDDK
jgi:hypothetical protein